MTAVIAIIVIAVALLVVAAVFFVLGRRDTTRAVGTLSAETKSRDRDRRSAELAKQTTDVEAWTPPTAAEIGVSRRQFLNRGIWSMAGLGALGFGAGLVSFLWPRVSGGFGSKITLGQVSDLKAKIQAANGFYYVPEGQLYVVNYPASALPKARTTYQPAELAAMEQGLTVLYQKCPHLGCRVPPCLTSQWFECPCHGSQYNQVGEQKRGPAPRGMDHFSTSVDGGVLTADTGAVIQGAPIGTDTTGQEPAGPHCVSGGE
ncbi:MAG: Rieske 2Fe-2S domain-containing protein [Actinobacteria bacterium]|nr:Rieske 2Fe-2S domain-containing protein [Actinomycetota bacterium]